MKTTTSCSIDNLSIIALGFETRQGGEAACSGAPPCISKSGNVSDVCPVDDGNNLLEIVGKEDRSGGPLWEYREVFSADCSTVPFPRQAA